ncbi:MAG: 50S ribosomal protein L11 [Candidatus ainarchaeum sp.]|nr:50S ribosomal protein L11 [Candidatus ainarchaeum sp.]MDD3975626.1 50S ribosomal protein L11 [Candidatus ainarchaeum sp.]
MGTIKVLVDAGKANAGPPIGPALGPLGINAMDVVNAINEATKDLEGIQVPVKIIIDNKKKFTIEVGSPQTSALIKKELNIKKGAQKSGTETVGNLSFDQIIKIAKAKYNQLVSKDLKASSKEILGTCKTMGVTVDGISIKDVIKHLNEGVYDSKF